MFREQAIHNNEYPSNVYQFIHSSIHPCIHPSIHPIILHWQLWQCWSCPSYLREAVSKSLGHREKKTTILTHTYIQFRAANICTVEGSQDTFKEPTLPQEEHRERLSSECQMTVWGWFINTQTICGPCEKQFLIKNANDKTCTPVTLPLFGKGLYLSSSQTLVVLWPDQTIAGGWRWWLLCTSNQ